MTTEEYKAELRLIEDEAKRKKDQLATRFALSNNPYKTGDLFTDNIGTIKIEKIQVIYGLSLPTCVYTGIELTKKGIPAKHQTNRGCYLTNDIKTT